jgi:phenylpyruvate tautomerase PptA (4-oxalocrotonate tautomerase family)
MPYLRISCPTLETDKYAAIALTLTNAINDLFYHPKARLTREELREKTTVHFVPYREGEFYIGAKTPSQKRACRYHHRAVGLVYVSKTTKKSRRTNDANCSKAL